MERIEMRTWIKMTATDIRRGKAGNANSCPVNLAIKRTLKIGTITVGRETLSYVHRRKRFFATLASKVTKWIGAFDAGKNPEPISFELVGFSSWIHV